MINKEAYIKKISKYSLSQLYYNLNDCEEAIRINPNNPKNNDYSDEINYIIEVINKKQYGIDINKY